MRMSRQGLHTAVGTMRGAPCWLLFLASGVQPDGEAAAAGVLGAADFSWDQAEDLDLYRSLAGPLRWPHGGPPPGPADAVCHYNHDRGEQDAFVELFSVAYI